MFERRSALAGAVPPGGHDGPEGQRRLTLGEVRGWRLVQIAAFATPCDDFNTTVWAALGAKLPERVGTVAANADGRRLLKIGVNKYWIITPESDDLSHTLRRALAPDIGAVTDLSHSRVCIFIDGSPARTLLAAGTALDLHPDVFSIGQFAMTGLHHTPVLIHRVDSLRYEIFAMRTTARWVLGHLTDAALPFGYSWGTQ